MGIGRASTCDRLASPSITVVVANARLPSCPPGRIRGAAGSDVQLLKTMPTWLAYAYQCSHAYRNHRQPIFPQAYKSASATARADNIPALGSRPDIADRLDRSDSVSPRHDNIRIIGRAAWHMRGYTAQLLDANADPGASPVTAQAAIRFLQTP